MCTIMTQRETLPAERRTRRASQKAVDKLMAYDRELKTNPGAEVPNFDDGIFGSIWGCSQRGTGKIYVWLDSMCFGNSSKKGFYYVRWHNSMLHCFGGGVSTADPSDLPMHDLTVVSDTPAKAGEFFDSLFPANSCIFPVQAQRRSKIKDLSDFTIALTKTKLYIRRMIKIKAGCR